MPLSPLPLRKAARINLTDVDAPGNGDFAVDDQHLAVIRFGQTPFSAGLEWIYRVKFDNLYPAVTQALKECGGCSVTAHTVVDEVYLNPFRLFLQQQIGKFATRLIFDIFHGKRFEIDMVSGILHRFEHGGIGSRTINEQRNFVPLRQRAFTHRFYNSAITLQHVRRVDGSL